MFQRKHQRGRGFASGMRGILKAQSLRTLLAGGILALGFAGTLQAQPTQDYIPTTPGSSPMFPPVPPVYALPAQNGVPVQAIQLAQAQAPAVGGDKVPEKVAPIEAGPQPRSLGPWNSRQVRMQLMGVDGVPVLGTTPVPNKRTDEEFKKYVSGFIDPTNTLDLVTSRSRLIILKEVPKRIQIGDENIAVYNLITPKEITIVGRTTGSTVLNLWFVDDTGKEKVLSYLVRVFPDPEEKERLERIYRALENEVNKIFPDSVVHLRLVGDKIVVTGQAHDAIEASQIIRLIRGNSAGGGNIGDNRAAAGQGRIPVDSLKASARPGDPNYATPGLENYEVSSAANVINMLRIPGEHQVNLKVVLAEVNRTAARSIGLNFNLTNNAGVKYFSSLTGGVGAIANLPTLLDGGQVGLAIHALKTIDYARTLSEPNLTTMNGQTASMQVGGSFPVPIVTGATATGLQGTSFVPYGVQLNFTPYITDKDRVRLHLNANISTRDIASGASVGNTAVPGLTTRNVNTIVEMREGQTMTVSGLIQSNIGANRTNLPLFGEIPVFNRLTGLDKTSAGEQELVILVTPELVHPMEPKEVPPLPGSDLFEPSDFEFYVLGRLESRRSQDFRSPVMHDLDRMRRYRECEQLYIFGPTGQTNDRGGLFGGTGGPGVSGAGGQPAMGGPPVDGGCANGNCPPNIRR